MQSIESVVEVFGNEFGEEPYSRLFLELGGTTRRPKNIPETISLFLLDVDAQLHDGFDALACHTEEPRPGTHAH